MVTFFNPYANDRNKSKIVNHVVGLGEGVDLEINLENVLAVDLEIRGCRVVVDGLSVGCVERDLVLKGGERRSYKFVLQGREKGVGKLVAIEGIVWKRVVRMEAEKRGLEVVGRIPCLIGGAAKRTVNLDAKLAEGETVELEEVTWQEAEGESGVEIVKSYVDGIAGYEGGVVGGGFKREREGVGIKLRATGASGKRGIGLQVVLSPPATKSRTNSGVREHVILLSYRGALVLEEEHEVGYWRTVELRVCAKNRAGPRITRMGVRDDFVGLELDLDYVRVVEELEKSRKFFVDKAGKVGMETMGRTLSTDARNLEFFASGGLSDSEEDDDKSIRSVGEGMGSVGEGGGWILPDLNKVVSYGRCGAEFTAVFYVLNVYDHPIVVEGCSISGGCSGVVRKVVKRIEGGIDGIRNALMGRVVLRYEGGALELREDVVEDFLSEHQDPVAAMGTQGVRVTVMGEAEGGGKTVRVGEWTQVEASVEGVRIEGGEGWCEFFSLGEGSLLTAGGARRRIIVGEKIKAKVAVGGAKAGTARVGIAVGGVGGGGVTYSKGVLVKVLEK